jgi:hypothetical protein
MIYGVAMLMMLGVLPRACGVCVVLCLRLFGKLFIILLVIVLLMMKPVKNVFLLLGLRFRVLLHYRAKRKLIFCCLMIIQFVWMHLFIVFYIHYFYSVLSWLNRLGQEKRLWFRNPVIIYYFIIIVLEDSEIGERSAQRTFNGIKRCKFNRARARCLLSGRLSGRRTEKDCVLLPNKL